ncbi:hypothetical protein KPH14_011342 [Odynerus spinipes]|uniref:Uncharacterized protein n=1 Tax=Odynerus spinipes TaxID=1348599 RepID=A0AAD9VNC5_9HYME|nr:hypothetical protein KPH14_011342 [Odynerus spinipes]
MKNDESGASKDDESVLRKKEKTPLRLRLTRVFSSSALRSPKSPSSASDSCESSPGRYVSPTVKNRYSWQVQTSGNRDNQFSRSSESGISSSASKSPINENSPDSAVASPCSSKSCCSPIWYTDAGSPFSGLCLSRAQLLYSRITRRSTLHEAPRSSVERACVDGSSPLYPPIWNFLFKKYAYAHNRYEVLAAAAAAKGKKVGERGGLGRFDSESGAKST